MATWLLVLPVLVQVAGPATRTRMRAQWDDGFIRRGEDRFTMIFQKGERSRYVKAGLSLTTATGLRPIERDEWSGLTVRVKGKRWCG